MLEDKITFDQARLAYPGVVRGLTTEYASFVYHCGRPLRGMPKIKPQDVLPLLLPAIELQINWMLEKELGFRPPWKHFSTWLNSRHWEFSPVTQQKTIKRCYKCKNVAETRLKIVPNKTCKVNVCERCW
jgi:hypothetical protein